MAVKNSRSHIVVRASQWLRQQLTGFLCAIREHHRWIDSPRARALEEWSGRISVLLLYGAYLSFAYFAYRLWADIPLTVAQTSPITPEDAQDMLDRRSSLFYVFAGAFLVPAGLFVTWFTVKWAYRLLEATAYHWLPRFSRGLFYPLVLCGVAFLMHSLQMPITTLLATAYVEARATVQTARQPGLRVVEAGAPAVQQAPELANTQTDELIEALRKRYHDGAIQPPPEPVQD